ncbi:MAG: hypothetical protein NTW14_00730 [bacterium]|nr:hypothetical protein [bacterium]
MLNSDFQLIFAILLAVMILTSVPIIAWHLNKKNARVLRQRIVDDYFNLILEPLERVISAEVPFTPDECARVNKAINNLNIEPLEIIAGELFPDEYRHISDDVTQRISKIITKYITPGIELDKLLAKIKVNILAGEKIMVRDISQANENIHPVVGSLFNDRFEPFFRLWLIKPWKSARYKNVKLRLPYHLAYSNSLHYAILELPHKEGKRTTIWLKNLTQNDIKYLNLYRCRLEEVYNKIEVTRSFLKEKESSKEDLFYESARAFSKKKLRIKAFVKSFAQNAKHSLTPALSYHFQYTRLSMINWKPGEHDLFSTYDQQLLEAVPVIS